MAGYLLTDIPAAGFQAVVLHLAAADFANLRLVSRCISSVTTKHIPFIDLWLSATSSTQQLHQWHQATQHMKHVPSVHILVTGTIAADVFQMATQLLLQRRSIRHLQINAWQPFRKAQIPSTQLINPLMQRLQTLQLSDGMTVADMAGFLQQLAVAQARGWKLQHLTLQASWTDPAGPSSWSEVCTGLGNLATASTGLRELDLKLPPLELDDLCWQDENNDDVDAYLWLPNVAVVAALANSLVRLTALEVVTITDVPNIWVLPKPLAEVPADFLSASPSATAQTEAANALLASGLLPSLTAAGATFLTLDDLGCWLLQHMPNLKKLQIQSTGVRPEYGETCPCAMCWQRQQEHAAVIANSSVQGCKATATAVIGPMQGTVTEVEFSHEQHALMTSGSQVDSSDTSLSLRFHESLSSYSSSPDSDLVCHISSCCLGLHLSDIDGLGDLLADLKSLRNLEVHLHQHRRPSDGITSATAGAAAAAVIAAAARVKGLQSLVFHHSLPAVESVLPCDSLLPLTSAAGGPGSSLRRLELLGEFSAAAAACSTLLATTWSAEASQVYSTAGRGLITLKQLTDQLSAACINPGSKATTVRMPSCAGSPAASYNRQSASAPQVDNSVVPASIGVAPSFCSSVVQDNTGSSTTGYQQPSSSAAGGHQTAVTTTRLDPILLLFWPLKDLSDLRRLDIINRGAELMTFQVECLPASLEMLVCCRLKLVTASGVASATVAADHALDGQHADLVMADAGFCTTMNGRLQLKTLHLAMCHLSSPSILASDELQKLKIQDSSWPGGWTAAAAAWPSVKVLEWSVMGVSLTHGGGDQRRHALANAYRLLKTILWYGDPVYWTYHSVLVDAKLAATKSLKQCITDVLLDFLHAGFPHVQSVLVQDLAWLSHDVLQQAMPLFVLQNPSLKQISFHMSPASQDVRNILSEMASMQIDSDTDVIRIKSKREADCLLRNNDVVTIRDWLQLQFPVVDVDVVEYVPFY